MNPQVVFRTRPFENITFCTKILSFIFDLWVLKELPDHEIDTDDNYDDDIYPK